MAIVKFTAIVDEIRGSIGGTTFQRNAYGWSIKRKPNIIRPNTLRQQVSKTSFGSITRYWSTLSQVNRDSWDTYASTYPIPSIKNPSVDITGFNYFVKYHLIKFTTGSRSFLDNATAASGSLTFTSFVLESNNLDWFQLVFDYVSSSDLFISLFFLSPPLEDSRVVPRLTPLYIDSSLPTSSVSTARTVDISLAATYDDLYNTLPVVGSSVVVRIPSYNTVSGALDFLSEFRVQVVYGNAIKAVTAAYFKLDDLTGPVIDSVAGNNGTNVGATRGVTGKIDDCFSFDGISNRVEIGATVTEVPCSFSAWIKTSATTGTRRVVTVNPSGTTGSQLSLVLDNGKVIAQQYSTTIISLAISPSSYADNNWHFVVAVFASNSSRSIYVDGTLQATNTVTNTAQSGIDSTSIGYWPLPTNSDFYVGLIDEVGIYNAALSATQITELYNSGSGLSYPF